jgi:hypothetical protein
VKKDVNEKMKAAVQGKVESIPLPPHHESTKVDDVREEVQRYSQARRPSAKEKCAFYDQKLDRAKEWHADQKLKDELLYDLEQSKSIAEEEAKTELEAGPIPGGVGHGVFYKDTELRFTDSSTLFLHIVAAQDIGDTSNEWTFLTATNRSPKGVEAYLSYRKMENPAFKIFDWSKDGDARWVIHLTFAEIQKYMNTVVAGGATYKTIFVRNRTRRVSGNRWTNEVFLFKPAESAYDFVYSSEYTLTLFQEQGFRDWGPIVETFKPNPSNLRDIGFFAASLEQDTGAPTLLPAAKTTLSVDSSRFQTVFVRGHDSFIVH